MIYRPVSRTRKPVLLLLIVGHHLLRLEMRLEVGVELHIIICVNGPAHDLRLL